MKEQWKKLDSNAKLLVNIEEGNVLPIKIELPISTFASKNDCCKKVLTALRIFVLLTFLILLAWTAVALYTSYCNHSTVHSDQNVVVEGLQPLSKSKVNELSLQMKIYEAAKEDIENPKSIVVDATTESVKDDSYLPEKYNEDTESNFAPKKDDNASKSLLEKNDLGNIELSNIELVDDTDINKDYSKTFDELKDIIDDAFIKTYNNKLIITAINNESSKNFLLERVDLTDFVSLEKVIEYALLKNELSDEEVNETSVSVEEEINNSYEEKLENNNDEEDSENVKDKIEFTSSDIEISDEYDLFQIKRIMESMFKDKLVDDDLQMEEDYTSSIETEDKSVNEKYESSIQEENSEGQKEYSSNESTDMNELYKMIDNLSEMSKEEENISDETATTISAENYSSEKADIMNYLLGILITSSEETL